MDLLILSNGPGEVSTWVKPVVAAFRNQMPGCEQLRISVVLSPCPNATGQEGHIVRQYPEVDRVQDARDFWPFLLWGKTAEQWDWRDRGVVLFLGGDQIYPVVIGKRLGYKTVIYAEWFANWPRWINAFGAMNAALVEQAPAAFRSKFQVVGDLMNTAQAALDATGDGPQPLSLAAETELIGLLPGSKPAKLTQGVPLAIATADYIHQRRSQTRFVIPVAPTITPAALTRYAAPQHNRFVSLFQSPSVQFVPASTPETLPYLITAKGTRIYLWEKFPAYTLLSRCQLCLTTVGANTAELGSLGIPMIVLLPTQQLEAMNAWDGLLGLIVNLPLLGRPVNRLINRVFLAYIRRNHKLFAWPNIWAQREIVPELLGPLSAEQVGEQVLNFLSHPHQLLAMRQALQSVRGQAGAAQNLVNLVFATAGIDPDRQGTVQKSVTS